MRTIGSQSGPQHPCLTLSIASFQRQQPSCCARVAVRGIMTSAGGTASCWCVRDPAPAVLPSRSQTAMWDFITAELAQLGPEALALVEDDPVLAGLSEAEAAPAAAEAAAAGRPLDAQAAEGPSNEQLVEYEGMLVSAAAAQRRRYRHSLPPFRTPDLTRSRAASEPQHLLSC